MQERNGAIRDRKNGPPIKVANLSFWLPKVANF
jgi:hypothetical protein